MIGKNNMKPITPDEVVGLKKKSIPPFIIECINDLIAKKWNGRSAPIKQEEIIGAIMALGIGRRVIFDNHYLDVEDIYEDAGWNVVYDKPGFNETNDAFFIFTKK